MYNAIDKTKDGSKSQSLLESVEKCIVQQRIDLL